jgi:hypothetical protein
VVLVVGVVGVADVAAPATEAIAPDARTADAVSARTRCGMRDMNRE